MGTWSVPFENLKTAAKFKKLMEKPWLAITRFEPGFGRYTWDALYVNDLCGSDDLYDMLDSKTLKSKGKPFDLRPIVKRYLKPMLQRMEKSLDQGPDIEALNTVRIAVGLKPLVDKPFHKGPRNVASQILTLLAKNRIKWVQTKLDQEPQRRNKPKAKLKTRTAKNPTVVYNVYLDRKSAKTNLSVVKKALSPLKLKSIKKRFGHILVIEFVTPDTTGKRKNR